jgi:hypothetical protein
MVNMQEHEEIRLPGLSRCGDVVEIPSRHQLPPSGLPAAGCPGLRIRSLPDGDETNIATPRRRLPGGSQVAGCDDQGAHAWTES